MAGNGFVHQYKLKGKATSNLIIYQFLSPLSLSDAGIYLGDDSCKSDLGVVTLHLS